MKKLFISSIILCASVFYFCVLNVEQVNGAETLKIMQDQFEFRDEPRVAEETLLGTLRIGTPVEWTGKTSGSWFEVQAPNGQLGWVHQSGLSTPKSLPKPTPKPKSTPRPESEKPQSVPRTSSNELQKEISELEKTNTQYQALLEEKNGRIVELSGELKDLEQKLVETAQSLDDTKQIYEREKLKVNELNESLEQTQKELDTGKLEVIKLQNQFTDVQKQTGVERFLAYLNIIWVILLGIVGLLYVRQKRHEKLEIEADIGEHKNYIISKQHVSETPKAGKPLVEHKEIKYEQPGVSKAGEPVTVSAEEEDIGGEEVIIELSDVLPVQSSEIGEAGELVEEIQDVEIITEEPEEVQEIEDLEEIEEIEEIEELEDIEELGEIEELEEIEEVEEVGEVEEIEEPGEIEELEEIEEVEEVGEVEEIEELEDVEETGGREGTGKPLEELEEILEGEGEEGGDFDYDYEDFYPESMMDSTSEVTSSSIEEGEEVEEEKGTTVEIDGEEFEMLVEQSTQIIEPEEKSYEEQAEEAEDIEEIEIINDIEDIEEIIEEGEFEDVGEVEEIEEIVELVEVVEEVELDKSLQDVESEELEQPSTPTLLEPSPILIEPEHEPAEPSLGQDQELVVPPPESKGPKYDIELVNVGKNRGRILHILSKIEGLSKSPQELVDAVPSIIVRGAKEQDAKNFQVVMQKLGSNVRLIRK